MYYSQKGEKQMRQIIKALNDIKGKDVNIYTNHKIFGKQHIKMEFEPETEIGVGFRCRDQVIYMDNNEIVDFSIEDGKVIINGEMMSIIIVEAR